MFLLALFLLFFGLGFRSLWGSEDRWAEVTREMLLFRDFFHPRINGQPYFDKPLLTYWAIIPASWLAGALNELAARLPSAVSGLVALFATMGLGRKLFGRVRALLAGALLLGSVSFLFWSRTAAADSENMAAVILAVWWYFSFRTRPGFPAYCGFYLICALGAHFKGLTAVAVPAVAVLPDILSGGRWKEHLSLSNAAALVLGLLVYVLPFVYAALTANGYGENGLALAFRENLLRFFRAFDHKEPFYCYLYYVPFLFMPWIFLLAGAAWDRIRNWRGLEEGQRWIGLSVLGIFLLFTLSSSRRSYYILPILPFLALFTADFLIRPFSQRTRDLAVKSQAVLLAIAGLAELSTPALWPVIKAWNGFSPPPSLKLATLLTGASALLVLAAGRTSLWKGLFSDSLYSRLTSLVLSAFVILGGFFCFQQNSLEVYRTRKPFILKLKKMIPDIPPERIGMSKNMAGVVFYLDLPRPLVDLQQPGALAGFLEKPGQKVIISRKKDAGRIIPQIPPGSCRKLLAAREFSWSHRNDKGLVAWKVY